MNDRETMLKAIAAMVGDSPKPPALIAVALRDAAAFYARENPFTEGDLVTPRKGAGMKGVGDAHIVISINEGAEHDFASGQVGSTAYGRRLDLRVLCWKDGDFAAFWVESAAFEPWVDPAEKAGVNAEDLKTTFTVAGVDEVVSAVKAVSSEAA